MERKPSIEVCLSPALFKYNNLEEKNIVVIDVLRATSTICNALFHGAKAVVPVEHTEDCFQFKGEEYLLAGERNGTIAEGFDFGNSPLEYTQDVVKDKTLVLTTTNGTKCLNMSKSAGKVIAASFPNLSAVAAELLSDSKDVILFCAGWKDHFNLEDTLFAGAVTELLKYDFNIANDSAFAARQLYVNSAEHLHEVIRHSSHFKRLSHYGVYEDIEFCLTPDIAPVLPVLNKNHYLVNKLNVQ